VDISPQSETWSVEGSKDRRILAIPLEIGSIGDRPLNWRDHLRPLMVVQDLINLAYEGCVPAENATVHFKYKNDERPLQNPEMWNSGLMAV